MGREKGRTLWFNNAEGHGIILSARGDELPVFFPHISMDGFKTLREGQLVEFERFEQPGPDGVRDVAFFVVPLNDIT